LRRQHHAVDVVEDGVTGLDFALTGVHDVVLLDILLPGIDGLEVCRRMRSAKSRALVIMITARGETRDKVAALDSGADDYLVKPVDLAELAARIRAVSRRNGEKRAAILERGPLRLDPVRRSVSYDRQPIVLTRNEYCILETLMQNPSQIFTRQMLREKTTTFEDDGDRDSVKTHITNLRRKFRGAGAQWDPIDNVYGLGYRLADFE
jgi:DNA-binding response OmpR family regulator